MALITALLMVAILTSLSIYLAWDLSLGVQRTRNMLEQDRTYALCLGAEAWAAQMLTDNARKHPNLVTLSQTWATVLPPIDVGGAQVTGRLVDLQGRINLNDALADGTTGTAVRARLGRLLEEFQAQPDRVQAVIDWIDANNLTTGSAGAEDGYYLGLKPPYRAANQPFLAPSMLRMVRGFDAKLTAAIVPDLTALPAGTTLNVNTAPQAVLQALGLDPSQAKALIARRSQSPFDSVAQFLASPELKGLRIDAAGLGVSSHYFMLEAQATLGRARTHLYSVIDVDKNGEVHVLLRSRNTPP